MADDFDAGICSGSWWRTARSGGGFDTSTMQALAASVSCSTTITDIGSGGGGGAFGWSTAEMVETKARPSDEPSGSVSGPLIDPGFGLSPSTMDWNQSLFRSSGRAETSFHAMLQEPLSYFRPDSSIETDHQVHRGTQDMNQPFLLDQQQQPGFPMMLQGLFEPETKLQQSNIFDSRLLNYQSSPPMMMIGNYHGSSNDSLDQKFPQFLKSPPLKQQTTTNQLQFSNNAPFWNASATTISEARSGFYPSTPVHFVTQGFEQKPSCNHTTKSNSDSMSKKSGTSSEPALKKPRIEAPPPLPTFKVRKEKLGDRITALQQLVSPFGKTDTASVLHEAIDYIKFLHEQVSVYSSPYLKNGHPMQHQQNSHESQDGEGPKQDLRSRGLCLVPIEITDPVASETTADFWTPSFGGTYR